MTTLHAYFALRNQQAFQKVLEASKSQATSHTALSSSGGRSLTKHSPIAGFALSPICDVNSRDRFGRTVLHLAVSALDPCALEYVKLLLSHPRIDVNVQDTESRWTPLHRALYAGNLSACLLLLQRLDIDTSLKDFEGYTAFDVYNSTVEGTKPEYNGRLDLFTWGTNRNATLGVGDGDDRTYPDQIVISSHDETAKRTLFERLAPIHVKEVVMAKLHTSLVTFENHSNIRLCGFGSTGRLGTKQHTQYSFVSLPQFQHTVISVALGQDHTLALTKSGEVLSWGLNRFAQLGYTIIPSSSGVSNHGFSNVGEDHIQATPKRILGPLKKEIVDGVAACKTASACWTLDQVFTWGTNSGQLGYDKASQPVQVQPRKVPQIVQPVIGLAITDNAMACLLISHDVVIFWNDRHFKINFPTQNFPQDIQPYRPPQAANNASIAKIVASSEGTFAALSSNGEIFLFAIPSDASSMAKDKLVVKPHRVWTLRKQFSAVKDVALGSDASLILCTESGHVYVQSRTLKGGQFTNAKNMKFLRIPYIQRVVRVSASSTGAFAALRADCIPKNINVIGNTVAQDLSCMQPYLVHHCEEADAITGPSWGRDVDDDPDETEIQKDATEVSKLCSALLCDERSRKSGGRGAFDRATGFPFDADLSVVIADTGVVLPAHQVILGARCPALARVLGDGSKISELGITVSAPKSSNPRLAFSGCQSLSALVLLSYFYSDHVLAVWDRRIGARVEGQLVKLRANVSKIRSEVQTLARMLSLPHLGAALETSSRRVPAPCMTSNMLALYESSQTRRGPDCQRPDVVLDLADKRVYCHAVILRARSPFFASLFGDKDWTVKRWEKVAGSSSARVLVVDLKHLKSSVMDYVLRSIYNGGGEEMFNHLDPIDSVDGLLDSIFELMAAASELLLDRLLLICSSIVLKHVNLHNVSSVYTDAVFYHALDLVESVQGYMAQNLETLLEQRALDDLAPPLIKRFAGFIREEQAKKQPLMRSEKLLKVAMERNKAWVDGEDWPLPIVPKKKAGLPVSPKLSPANSAQTPSKTPKRGNVSPPSSPAIVAQPTSTVQQRGKDSVTGSADDDIFLMDDHDVIPSLNLGGGEAGDKPPFVPWKTVKTQVNKLDMKAIMAEAESSKHSPSRNAAHSTGRSNVRVVGFDPKANPGASQTPPGGDTTRHQEHVANTAIPHPSDSPWRSTAAPPSPSTPVKKLAPAQPSPSGLSRSIKEHLITDHATPRGVVSSSPATAPRSNFGPTFSPSKSQHAGPSSGSGVKSSGMARRASSENAAWTNTAFPPPLPPEFIASSSTSPPPSFLAIQQQQQNQKQSKPKRGLKEIQEEEEFMKWWEAEEERIKKETEAALAATVVDRREAESEKRKRGGGGGAKRGKPRPPFRGPNKREGGGGVGGGGGGANSGKVQK